MGQSQLVILGGTGHYGAPSPLPPPPPTNCWAWGSGAGQDEVQGQLSPNLA